MISASPNFIAENAKPSKKPCIIVDIQGYHYGFASSVPTNIPKVFPPTGQMALIGCFTDSSGNVILPIPIGARPTSYLVPAGATQLQLGINDTQLSDNSGTGFTVNVQVGLGPIASVNVPATAPPWAWTKGGQNAAYYFGPGSPSAAPVVAASGLTVGQVVNISYQSGYVVDGTFAPAVYGDGMPFVAQDGAHHPFTGDIFDNAYVNPITGGSGVPFPTLYMGSTVVPWLTDVTDHSTTVNDLSGGVDLADIVFNVQDNLQKITADFPGFVFEGKRMVLMAGFIDATGGIEAGQSWQPWEDFTVLFSGVIDTVASINANTEYQFTCASFNTKMLAQKIYTTGDDGFPIDSKHPRTINGNPIDILVSALGQCSIPFFYSIDYNKLYYYADTIFSGMSFQFVLISAPVAKDFIENELMKPLGGYLRENNLGMMTVDFFYPAISGGSGTHAVNNQSWSYTPPTPPVATLDSTTVIEMPIAGEAELVDNVTFRFDDDGSNNGKYLSESVQLYGPSIEKYGIMGDHIIESKGMRAASQGFLWSAIIARLIFLRYGAKNLVLDKVPVFWSQCLLEPGDIIQLTIAQVPNRAAGTLGVTNMTFAVLDRGFKFMSGQVELKLLALNLAAFKQYLITPNTEPSYASDTAANQAKYMYECGTNGLYSTGATANTLG